MDKYNLRNEIVNIRLIAERLQPSLISVSVLRHCSEYCLELMGNNDELFEQLSTTRFHIKQTLEKEIGSVSELDVTNSDFQSSFNETKETFISDISTVETFLK